METDNKQCGSCGRTFEHTPNLKTIGCPNFDCHKNDDECCDFIYRLIPSAVGTDEEGSETAPRNGMYRNAVVKYEHNNHLYFYDSKGAYVRIDTVIDIDDELSLVSQNPVENRIITLALTNFFTEPEWAEMWA